ncbi:hypothetical protein LR48_Vigan09g088600 [Vigna angularis]|uniref:Uncharacterized protein n=1 Tax=Phaseolus angularis TaxID=3914 RepID=A0A0L9VBC5_PHAAN|nr:hypothetical protein LR48_Vigan09g088600 [Vigna angularis]
MTYKYKVKVKSQDLAYKSFGQSRVYRSGHSQNPGKVLQELLVQNQEVKNVPNGRLFSSTRKFSRNSWVTDNRSCLLGSSSGTPRNSWVMDGHSYLLGSSPGTPGSRTIILVYWEVLQELLDHIWSFSSTRKFSRNSWVTDGHSRLLGSSLGTLRSRMFILVYCEVLQELLGQKARVEEQSLSSEHLQLNSLACLAVRPYKMVSRSLSFRCMFDSSMYPFHPKLSGAAPCLCPLHHASCTGVTPRPRLCARVSHTRSLSKMKKKEE